jgi:acyl transferase
MTKLQFEQHETRLGDGRRVAIWSVAPADGPIHPLPIVVGAGFARRMHHFAAVALYGACNGFYVCRYDPVNHVGISDGDMFEFSLSDSLDSLRAAVDWTVARTGQDPAVIATSLTARVAYQLAAETERIKRVITAVGVVNVRATMAKVFGRDYSIDQTSSFAEFEGKKIGRRFLDDAHAHDWWSLTGTTAILQRVQQPVTTFIGTEDDWVDPGDVSAAFSDQPGGPRRILTLERAPHDLSRDPAVARTFFMLMLEELLGACQVDARPIDPPFEDLMEQSLVERRIQRGTSEPEPAGRSASSTAAK